MGLPSRLRRLPAAASAALRGLLKRRAHADDAAETTAAATPDGEGDEAAALERPDRLHGAAQIMAAARGLPAAIARRPRLAGLIAAVSVAALVVGWWTVGGLRRADDETRQAVRMVVVAQRLGAQVANLRRFEAALIAARRDDDGDAVSSWKDAADHAHDLGASLAEGHGAPDASGELTTLLVAYVAAVQDARAQARRAPPLSGPRARAIDAAGAALDDAVAAVTKRAGAARRAAQRAAQAAIARSAYALTAVAGLVLLAGLGLGASVVRPPASSAPRVPDDEAPPVAVVAPPPVAPPPVAAPAPPPPPPPLGEQHARLYVRALEHLDVGLVTVDAERTLIGPRAAMADHWFGPPPAGASLDGWLGDRAPDFIAALRPAWDAIVDSPIGPPRDAATVRLPSRFSAGGRHWHVRYTMLEDDRFQVEGALIAFSDITAIVAHEQLGHAHNELLGLVERFNLDRRGAGELAEQLATRAAEVRTVDSPTLLAEHVRTLGDDLALHGVMTAAATCRELLGILDTEGDLSADERARLVERVDEVVVQVRALAGEGHPAASVVLDAELAELAQLISMGSEQADLEAALDRVRFEPVARLLAPAAESIRQIAAASPGMAAVDVEVKDHGVRLDGSRWRPFFAALVHVARHQVRAALETEDERLSGCKEPRMAFGLDVSQDGDALVVRIIDDGKGLAEETLRAAGRRAGRPTSAPENVIDAALTEAGNGGAGLLAARQECLELGGHVEVTSAIGEGTTVAFHFPGASGAAQLAA